MIRSSALRVCQGWAAGSRRTSIPTTITAAATVGTNVERLERFLHSTTFKFNTSEEEKGIKWRFPVDNWTKAMMRSVDRGMCVTIIFTLNSKAPITPDLMEEALVHLYGKIESFRTCFRMRDGQLWVADMPRNKLDFQVVGSTDLEHEHSELQKVKFDLHNGPLWNARLMTCPPDAPCPLPEVKAAYPYQCYLLMSAHHAANDGGTLLLMPDLLISIIDSLLEGSPVDTRPVGELRDGVEARMEGNRIRAELERDPEKLMASLKKHLATKHLPLLMEAYGVPKEADPTTIYSQPVLIDKEIMEKIAAKSCSIGASLSSCLNAILNISVMEVAREAGLERDVYNISTRLAVSSRRLMKSCESFPLGYHAIPFTHCISTPRDVKKNFWQYVERLHTEIHEKLNRNYMCEEMVLAELLNTEGSAHEAKFAREQFDFDHFFSNLCSFEASQQKGVGKNAQITAENYYLRFHNKNYPLAQMVFPFRGNLCLQNYCSTRAIDSRVANRCLEKNVSTLYDVSKMVD
ncbi:uncharacterized protein LOC126986988 [Eriocheir sinensis]|uniref:uncharacterized protein LOC126986988 n=1 Tax=Eriocheir sinensis TaxID=95602 RepID=UPI0021C78E4D|nr:uncharacterized protein LOC126986988 [Eriocheir sinensis]XP_050699651.1 uncharacterized protein LOC126986988 [Eriocheir sinensis]XP_050699716.1 uncharacterized protein LOC126986988 [Eriocheir sinensis]